MYTIYSYSEMLINISPTSFGAPTARNKTGRFRRGSWGHQKVNGGPLYKMYTDSVCMVLLPRIFWHSDNIKMLNMSKCNEHIF